MSGTPSFGDLVEVSDGDGNVVACGVVKVTPSTVSAGYGVDTAYADGWSEGGDSYLSGIDPDQVELVDSGYGQKWQRRVYGH